VAFLILLINLASQVITFLVIIHVVLSYFMSPFHPIRQTIDNLIEPLLAPIRRILPKTGMLDFSPFVLLLVVQLVARLLVGFLVAL